MTKMKKREKKSIENIVHTQHARTQANDAVFIMT